MSEETNDLVTQLTTALRESRSKTDQQLDELSRKLELVVPKIEQLQRDILVMQADMRTQYVTRAEYDPRHKVLEDKLSMYDRMVTDSRPMQERFFSMESDIRNQKSINANFEKAIEDADDRQRGALGRIVPWVSVAIAVLSLLSSFLGHIQFH